MTQKKNPYQVVVRRHVTEKAMRLQELESSESNPCVRACETPKAVFIVDRSATKPEIASAIESIYSESGVKVVKVNTVNMKGKPRRVRGRSGRTAAFKKAVVTFEKGDRLEDI